MLLAQASPRKLWIQMLLIGSLSGKNTINMFYHNPLFLAYLIYLHPGQTLASHTNWCTWLYFCDWNTNDACPKNKAPSLYLDFNRQVSEMLKSVLLPPKTRLLRDYYVTHTQSRTFWGKDLQRQVHLRTCTVCAPEGKKRKKTTLIKERLLKKKRKRKTKNTSKGGRLPTPGPLPTRLVTCYSQRLIPTRR